MFLIEMNKCLIICFDPTFEFISQIETPLLGDDTYFDLHSFL